MDEIWNISEGHGAHSHTKNVRNRPRGSAPECQNVFYYFLLSRQRGLSATYPAPISTIFETTDVNRFAHAYVGEKFSNFGAGNFPDPKTSQNTVLSGGVFVIELQLKRHNCGRYESIKGLMDIPRMCILYLSFGGGHMVCSLSAHKKSKF